MSWVPHKNISKKKISGNKFEENSLVIALKVFLIQLRIGPLNVAEEFRRFHLQFSS